MIPTLRLPNDKEVIGNLLQIAAKIPDAAEFALTRFGDIEIKEAIERAPEDERDLKSSGTREPAVRSGKKVMVALTFGAHGVAEEYALIQHEDLDLNHDTGQAKYLESVMNESEPHFDSRIAADIRQFLGL